MTGMICAAILAVIPAETELSAKLPEIFAKSAAHYKALDAAAAEKVKREEALFPHGWNRWKTGKDEYDLRSIYWWTSGHFAGSFWYLYEATGDRHFKDRATAWTEILAPNSKVTDNHDVGFIMYCSYGNARRLLKTKKYDALLVETANSLCQRYNEKLGLIRSWGPKDGTNDFLVIPDNMMNLELLEWAAGTGKKVEKVEKKGGGGQWSFDSVARSHADVTMKNHFRADGGCYHVLDYDQATGKVTRYLPGQGASITSAWARGESWAIYGYTMMYRTTGLVRYLDFAKKLADFSIGNPNMPADGIPYWDYGRPGEERDSSAGAIMASALLELSQYVGAADRDRYRGFAVKQLLALASPAYFSEGNEIGHFLLKHGVGHKPGKSEIDTPLDYGDYYFLEALLRFRQLKARENTIAAAKGLAALPSKATLPTDELLYRGRSAGGRVLIQDEKGRLERKDCIVRAEKYLKEPIPDTSDALYGEYWTTGNRTHYQKEFNARLLNLDALVFAEYAEGKGRFLPKIEEYLAAICAMKSWVLPAHDWSEGGKGTWRGTWISTDLFSTEVAANLACVVQLLGGRDGARPSLGKDIMARVKENAERRVFGPVRRETPGRLWPKTSIGDTRVTCLWWINGDNNWNAVCWDNIVCAACGLIDDPADRAFFVAAADKAANTYIALGFSADGYCSEGMGYWNYGFGHHLLTGRLLDKITDGKYDFFKRAGRPECALYRDADVRRGKKTRLVAAYVRAYTLREGASPAFADGNGAASPILLGLVDQYWPDLPHELPPASEFPDGQVWLLRDPQGLSVAFKGGHNGELHNHNDLGSYWLMSGDKFVAGDPGGEEYTRRTFSGQRYESKVLNSYGHPVPVVGGKLQGTGAKFAAKVLEKKVEKKVKKLGEGEEGSVGEGEEGSVGEGRQRSVVVLDLTGAYEVKALKKLMRTFVYDREANTFTVTDRVEFTEPTAFEDCYVTLGGKVNVEVKGSAELAAEQSGEARQPKAASRRASEQATVDAASRRVNEGAPVLRPKAEELIENTNRKTVHRFAYTFDRPVMSAEVEFSFGKDN